MKRYQQQGDRQEKPKSSGEVGLTFEKVASFEEAAGYYQQGLHIGQELEQPFLIATGHLYLANWHGFKATIRRPFNG
ncbi:MAG: hypothetical protein R3B83_02670 [Nitrospirales bacterium]|nr:hypothetical protein [Nitrospirales bacterium]